MKTIALVLLTMLVVANMVPLSSASDFKYASDEEINLIMGQADRAMMQYEQVLGQEKRLLGDSIDTDTDNKLLVAWKTVKGVLAKDPQKYNSFVGFDIVTLLDDAARNNALITTSAATELIQELTGGKLNSKSDSLITLMQNSQSAGTLLYTVAESAAALYLRFLHWQDETFNESVVQLTKCMDIIKKSK